MTILRIALFTCFTILVSITSARCQNLKYSVVWKGDSIGHINANKYDSAEFFVYKIESEVSFWFFGTRTIQYDYITLYKKDTLIKASTKYKRNGDLKSESHVALNGSGYDIVVDGNVSKLTEPNPIGYSVTAIYYNEPKFLSEIFSERWGEILKVTPTGQNQYSIEKPDGRKTEYFFENGICSRVIVDNFFATFTFERSK